MNNQTKTQGNQKPDTKMYSTNMNISGTINYKGNTILNSTALKFEKYSAIRPTDIEWMSTNHSTLEKHHHNFTRDMP